MRAARRAEVPVALAALAALALGCGRSDPPRLKVTAFPPAAQELRFQLRNVGGRELVFDGLAPACGCTVASRLPDTLAPGASSVIAVRCRAGGDAVRELRLRSSDPGNPETVLRPTVPADGAIRDPAALYFGYVPVGGSEVRDVALAPTASLDALPASEHPELAIEPQAARPDGRRGVRVRFTPRLPGVVRTTIDLGAAGGALPIAAVGYDGVLAYPAEIALSAAASTPLPAITIIATGDRPLAIARVDYPPGITGELRTVVPGRQFRVVLRGRGRVDAAGSAAIRLLGAAGSDPLLTIPVVGFEGGAAASSS